MCLTTAPTRSRLAIVPAPQHHKSHAHNVRTFTCTNRMSSELCAGGVRQKPVARRAPAERQCRRENRTVEHHHQGTANDHIVLNLNVLVPRNPLLPFILAPGAGFRGQDVPLSEAAADQVVDCCPQGAGIPPGRLPHTRSPKPAPAFLTVFRDQGRLAPDETGRETMQRLPGVRLPVGEVEGIRPPSGRGWAPACGRVPAWYFVITASAPHARRHLHLHLAPTL